MATSPYTEQERARLKWCLCFRIEMGVPATIAAHELGLDFKAISNWTRSDPVFKQSYDDACDACYQKMADRLTVLHEEVTDPKVAKNVADNIKWWLSKRKVSEFGEKLVVRDEHPELIGILQSAINRLIDHTIAQQPLKVIEERALRIRGDDPAAIADRHKP